MIFSALVNTFFYNLRQIALLLPDAPTQALSDFNTAFAYFKIRMFYVNEFIAVDTLFMVMQSLLATLFSVLIYKTFRQFIRGV